MSLMLVTGKLLWPFGSSMILDSPCSLKSGNTVFAFTVKITSSSLYYMPSEEKYLLSTPLGILRLSETLYEYDCSTILAPSCGRILKLARLLSILQKTRLKVLTASLFLPKTGAKCLGLWSLQGLKIKAKLLCMLISFLQKLVLATIHSMHWNPTTVLGYMRGCHTGHW